MRPAVIQCYYTGTKFQDCSKEDAVAFRGEKSHVFKIFEVAIDALTSTKNFALRATAFCNSFKRGEEEMTVPFWMEASIIRIAQIRHLVAMVARRLLAV